jgi:2-polyprenyl-3-methyl-5-hydroxy-6-metoxy-1,4-benzoquinol methylase
MYLNSNLSNMNLLNTAQIVNRGIFNVYNKYLSNTHKLWDKMYEQNYSDKMDSVDQQPRNYIISGLILAKTNGEKHNVLDVGCGNGSLYDLIPHNSVSYHGIDFSQKAIKIAKERFGNQPFFEVTDFDCFNTSNSYDAIIFNESLYYFKLLTIKKKIEKAIELLKDKNSFLIISMSSSAKSFFIWRMLSFLSKPMDDIVVKSLHSNSKWNIKSFRNLKH